MNIQEDFDYIFKVVVIGDSGVGKTSLIKQFSLGEFDTEMRTTLGVEMFMYNNEIADKKIRTQIWDTAGQERFRAITNLYYRKAAGVILVYDITNHSSFRHLEDWFREARLHVDPDACVAVLGNKCDLRHLRSVPRAEAEQFAKTHDINFLEVSASDASNVQYGFESLISEMYHLHTFKQAEYECNQIQKGDIISARPQSQRTTTSQTWDKGKRIQERCCQ